MCNAGKADLKELSPFLCFIHLSLEDESPTCNKSFTHRFQIWEKKEVIELVSADRMI